MARSHRRRGIATAIKVRSIRFAKDLGYRAIQTDNEENNPMYDLNLRLGFRPTKAWLQFRMEVRRISRPTRMSNTDDVGPTTGE